MSADNTKPSGVRVVTKKAPKPKIRTDQLVDLDFMNVSVLPDSMTFLIASDCGVVQHTIHHPIGFTDLDSDDWVITPTSEIPVLLSRADDPEERKRVSDLQLKVRETEAVEQGTVVPVDGKLFYPGEIPQERAPLVTVARKAAEAKFKALLKQEEKTEKKPKGPAKKLDPKAYLDELSPEVKVLEQKFLQVRDSPVTLKKAEAIHPFKYRTRGGPLADRDQIACPPLKGMSKAKVQDFLTKSIYGFLQHRDPGKGPDGDEKQP